MDEQVQEWIKKKLQTISAEENILSQPTPEEPVQEEPKKPEKKILDSKEIKERLEIKQQPKAKQPIDGSVVVEDKISEYIQKVVDAENYVIEKPAAKNPAVKNLGSVDEQQPKTKSEQQPQVKDGIPTGEPTYPKKSSMLKIPKLFGQGLGLFSNRKVLVLIISSVAGIVSGYLVFLFLVS